MTEIKTVGEFGLIEMIGEIVPRPSALICGIGDDCAVLPFSQTHNQLVTCDLLNEGVHFLKDKISPYQLGYKAVAASLSDIAAMGGEAISVLVAVGLPDTATVEMWQLFYQGVAAICHEYNVNLIGGDTTKSQSGWVVNITALGLVAKQNLRLRSQAKSGDLLFVTGPLGGSRAGLELILHADIAREEWHQPLLNCHLQPTPCLAEAKRLNDIFGQSLHSLNDISDGLASECAEIAAASGVKIIIKSAKIPISQETHKLASLRQASSLEWALFGGEDYQLVGTIAAEKADELTEIYAQTGKKLWIIGHVTEGSGVWLDDEKNCQMITQKGYAHF